MMLVRLTKAEARDHTATQLQADLDNMIRALRDAASFLGRGLPDDALVLVSAVREDLSAVELALSDDA